MKKEFLILFSDVHLPYSPTTLNIFYALKKAHKVTLFAPDPKSRNATQKIDDPDIIYLTIGKKNGILSYLYTLLIKGHSALRNYLNKGKEDIMLSDIGRWMAYNWLSPYIKRYIKAIKSFDGEILAVDFFSLWCAQKAGKAAHLISLEVDSDDFYYKKCELSKVKSVLTQSEERFSYLFKNGKVNKFIVQNSPNYVPFEPDYGNRNEYELVYCGTATPEFGIFSCLDFIKDYPGYRLTIKGSVPVETLEGINQFYKELVDQGRLIIDQTYLDPLTLTSYLSKFRVGFVFYDFYRFMHLRTFNFLTSPSGKMFQYFNSGIPVIGNALLGLKLVEEAKAGILIDHLSSVTIKNALAEIERSYMGFATNSKLASSRYNFRETSAPYFEYLEKC